MNVNYKMGDTVLDTTVKEKDLGVTISADMKVSEQCGIAASKGNKILGLIRRNITYKGKKLIIPVYLNLIMVKSGNRSETGLFVITYPIQFVPGVRNGRPEEQGVQARYRPQL